MFSHRNKCDKDDRNLSEITLNPLALNIKDDHINTAKPQESCPMLPFNTHEVIDEVHHSQPLLHLSPKNQMSKDPSEKLESLERNTLHDLSQMPSLVGKKLLKCAKSVGEPFNEEGTVGKASRDKDKDPKKKESAAQRVRSALKIEKERAATATVTTAQKMPKINHWKEWPSQFKEQLRLSHSDVALYYFLDYFKALDVSDQRRLYERIWEDTEILSLLCDRMLEIAEPKQPHDAICEWFYHCFAADVVEGSVICGAIDPSMVWCMYSRDAESVSGIATSLLSLYKKEKRIYAKYQMTTLDNPLSVTHMPLFPSFDLPNLTIPSLFHCPFHHVPSTIDYFTRDNTLVSCQDRIVYPASLPILFRDFQEILKENSRRSPSAHSSIPPGTQKCVCCLLLLLDYFSKSLTKKKRNGRDKRKHDLKTVSMAKKDTEKQVEKEDYFEDSSVLFHFPLLRQGNLGTNLQLIHVALQVLNKYISKMNDAVLEQYCAVIAKICSSGIDASEKTDFPGTVQYSLKYCKHWKWYTSSYFSDASKKRFIVPSEILCEFLMGLRYALLCCLSSMFLLFPLNTNIFFYLFIFSSKIESVKELAQFALAQYKQKWFAFDMQTFFLLILKKTNSYYFFFILRILVILYLLKF
ncbi:hypothetical protein RFI_06177 [Reticulomyxa filosa]|uniref:Uncharacterized protein n=1 Tax=Reticulomyxa filosa TaxID=46433 RepID=X6P096_RETFI|nr:hypothetical protein RFI_06177 [Reticulomyxa filosa]|eukprot:ETO30942.1 hypothetical protein RFI_06177 [Reticulomyxa filosa]